MFSSILVAVAILGADAETGGESIAVSFNGIWTAAAPDGTAITYDFQGADTVVWFVEEPNFKKMWPNGLRGKYKVRVARPLWEINIEKFESPEFKDFSIPGNHRDPRWRKFSHGGSTNATPQRVRQ